MFLRSIEMSTDPAAVNDPSGSDDDEGAAAPASTTVEGEGRSTDLGKIMNTGGWKTRTWWDLKLVSPVEGPLPLLFFIFFSFCLNHAFFLFSFFLFFPFVSFFLFTFLVVWSWSFLNSSFLGIRL